MRPRALLTLASGTGLLFGLGLLMAHAPAVAAASLPRLLAPRDASGRPLTATPGPVLTGLALDRWLRGIQPKIASGLVARNLARRLGIPSRGIGRTTADTGIRMMWAETTVGTDYLGNENTPSIAASPVNERLVVAVAHNDSSGTNQCTVYVSLDGGVTYDESYDLPLVSNPGEYCVDPVVRATPGYTGDPPTTNLSNFVFTYVSMRADSSAGDVMTYVTDATVDPTVVLAGPTVVVSSSLGFLDGPWIGVHTFDAADLIADGDNMVYLTTMVFKTPYPSNPYDCAILFSRSTDYGTTWAAPTELATSPGCTSPVKGPHVAAGPGSQVLVCYYDAGIDGFNVDAVSGGKFNISCDSSKDRGLTFPTSTASPPHILASKDIPYELPRALQGGPSTLGPVVYHDIWRSMFPSLDIDHTGTAHIVFAADPSLKKDDIESGNVFYIKSIYPNGSVPTAPAYDKWVARIAIGTGVRAQVFPTVVSQRTNTQQKPFVWVAYADHSRGDVKFPNRVYDIKYRKSSVGGTTFAAPVLVTTQSSLSQEAWIGDYFDSAATMRRYHVIWTDRADKLDVQDPECDVFTRWY